MDYDIVELKEKTVAGLAARTNNLSPEMGAVIGGLWKQFYGEGIYGQLKHKVSGKAMGIYSDYAGDETGDYTITVACEVEDADGLPEGVTSMTIPGGFGRWILTGPLPMILKNTRMTVWRRLVSICISR